MLELLVARELSSNGMSICLKPRIPFVITPTLAHEVRILQNTIAEDYYKKPWDDIFYVVWHLYSGRITWRGFDFNFIHETLIHNHDRVFENYVQEVFDLLYINYVGFGLPLINCSILDRTVKGISQEFFMLNRINFIKNAMPMPLSEATNNSVLPMSIEEDFSHLAFPLDVYRRNRYYSVSHRNLFLMQSIIEGIKYKALTEEELINTKVTFEDLKTETFNAFYEMRANNPKMLERLAKIQSGEYKKLSRATIKPAK